MDPRRDAKTLQIPGQIPVFADAGAADPGRQQRSDAFARKPMATSHVTAAG